MLLWCSISGRAGQISDNLELEFQMSIVMLVFVLACMQCFAGSRELPLLWPADCHGK